MSGGLRAASSACTMMEKSEAAARGGGGGLSPLYLLSGRAVVRRHIQV